MKTLLCAIAKLENNYIKEWVEYHKNIGFTNIVLYDNNDIDGEVFDNVLSEYILSGYVIINNKRGVENAQVNCYKECFNEYKDKYDWIGFWDIDEFIKLETHSNIQDFLSQEIFNDIQCIRLCWKQYTDNNLVTVVNNDYSVMNRFTEVFSKDFCLNNNIPFENYLTANTQAKSIVRTNITNFKINSPHVFLDVPTSNAIGELCINNRVMLGSLPVWKGAWLNHYRFKTIEEYLNGKSKRGWPTQYMGGGKGYLNMKFFLKFNKLTKEKKEYIRQNIPSNDKIQVNSFVKLSTYSGKILPNNWGDELNFNFLPQLFKKEVSLYDGSLHENYAMIGSILTDYYINEETVVWGSGIQNNKDILKNKPKKVCAVRGPLTREFLLKNGVECPEVYGDPALLLPKIYNPNIEKKYKIGVIKHWQSKLTNDYLILNNNNILTIDLHSYEKWTDIIDAILSCEYIVSESLHGLIVAEAYEIPNLWINIYLNKKYDIKFHDFFLSLGLDRESAYKLEKNTTINDLLLELSKYKKGNMVDLNKLTKSCPINIKLDL